MGRGAWHTTLRVGHDFSIKQQLVGIEESRLKSPGEREAARTAEMRLEGQLSAGRSPENSSDNISIRREAHKLKPPGGSLNSVTSLVSFHTAPSVCSSQIRVSSGCGHCQSFCADLLPTFPFLPSLTLRREKQSCAGRASSFSLWGKPGLRSLR